MNVQEMRSRLNNLGQDFKKIWGNFKADVKEKTEVSAADDQNHVMTDEEKLDESLRETFPASDPPGHFSKSSEDRDLH